MSVLSLHCSECDVISSSQEVCRLLLHLCHPEVFSRLGVRPPQGFLLHGPPGSGKTLLAHAIAHSKIVLTAPLETAVRVSPIAYNVYITLRHDLLGRFLQQILLK